MKTIAAAMIAAAVAIPTVASAAPKPAESIESPSASAPVAQPDTRRYCVVDRSITGTRLERRECRTLQAWLADGFDPRQK